MVKMTQPSANESTALPMVLVNRTQTHPLTSKTNWLRLQKFWLLALTAISLVGAAVWAKYSEVLTARNNKQQTVELAPRTVVALGRLVPAGELRALAAPYAAGDAVVSEVLVKEGQQVKAGDILVRFDNAEALNKALKIAEQQLKSRLAALSQTERIVVSNQAESSALWDRAQAAEMSAETEYQRWASLSEQGFVSQLALDAKKAQRDQAIAEVKRAVASLNRYSGKGTEQPDVRAAQQAVELAIAEYERAKQDIARSTLRAPNSGTVIAINVRPGERPVASGVLVLGNTQVMNAEIEIYQGDVGRVSLGQSVALKSPALSEPLIGKISRVGLSVGRQKVTDTTPAANTDARVVLARVTLDEPSSVRARSLVGLEVQAKVQTDTP